MKHMVTQAVSLLLCAVLLLSLAACGAVDEPTDTTARTNAATLDESASEPDRAHTPDSLPDGLSFDGAVVRIAHGSDDPHGDMKQREINPTDLSDTVNQAIYERNVMVADRLQISYDMYCLGTPDELAGAIESSISAGADDFDIVMNYQWKTLPQVIKGYFTDLYEADYIDLDKPWWWTEYMDELKVGKTSCFTLIGDIGISGIKLMSAMFFNKSMMQDLQIDPDSVYETVLDGTWTYELFSSYLELAYRDANGNGKRDMDDIYGVMIRAAASDADHFTYTAGYMLTGRDEDGIPTLLNPTEKYGDFMSFLANMYHHNEGVYLCPAESLERSVYFAEDHELFLADKLRIADELRHMRTPYGIITYPKWIVSEEYHTLVHDSATLISLPTTVKAQKTDMCLAVIEALSAQSYRTVIPEYYDLTLKLKYSSDSVSGRIIDMIKDNAGTDFMYAYNYALKGIGLLGRKIVQKDTANLASLWKSSERSVEKPLRELIEAYQKYSRN